MEKYNHLVEKIQNSYESGITIEEAERLAGQFLHAMLQIAAELQDADLNARMRKSGLKTMRSAVRTDAISKAEKKPTEGQLEDVVNLDPIVNKDQDALDKAEVHRDSLQMHYNIFKEAHLFYRGISRGNYNG